MVDRVKELLGDGVDVDAVTNLLSTLFGAGDKTRTSTQTNTSSGGDLAALRSVWGTKRRYYSRR
jgi:hypothetical protein